MTQAAEPLTPAQAEQEAYGRTGGVLAIRDNQFTQAPAYIPGEGEWAALKEMARSLCITEFVPKEMRGRPYAVLGAMLTARDLGLPITLATRRIYVVNGRPSLETAVKVALVRNRGHKIRVTAWTNELCTVAGWRKGDPVDEVMEVTYTMEDAKIAGDYDKPGDTYKKRPRQMLYARAAGLLCDTYFSDVTLGMPDPDEAALLPGEVIEGRYADADRRGELPAMPTDMPLTDEERAQRFAEGQAAAVASLPQVEPPPPPRTRRRGRGPEPVPQQGSDSGVGSSPSAAAAPTATADSSARSSPVSDAEMARGLDLPELAERIERGEDVSRDAWEAARRAETAATASEPPSAPAAAPGPAEPPPAQAPPAGDPFAAEAAAAPPDLGTLRQRAETYADFLMRRKLERAGQSPKNLEDLRRQAVVALDAIAKQMFGHGYLSATESEVDEKLLPWLRKRYADEGGTEP